MSISRQLFNVGEDAFKNHFKLNIIAPEKISSSWKGDFSIRVNDLTIPSQGGDVYEVPFLTHKIVRKKSTISNPTEVSFNIRVDENWQVYKALLEWKQKTENNTTGKLGVDTKASNFRTDILVSPIRKSDLGGEKDRGEFTFKQCLIKEIGEVGFDYATSGPITVQATLIFLDLIPTVGV